jgi:hypothetical protein
MPPLASASSAVEAGIKAVSALTPTPKKAIVLLHAGEMDASSSSHRDQKFASNGMSALSASLVTDLPITSAWSVVLKTTPSPHENVSNYNKIVTPLSADGFNILLHCYNLTSRYPNLSWNLHNGFPLGEFDYLHNSYIHPNHPNSDSNNTQILKYIQDEVSEGRMSGLFTLNELKKEARGEVIVSPLGAVDKAGEPGKLRIIRDLSFQGKAPFSVNDKIDPNSYLTKWSTAAMIIDLVSPSPSFILFSVFLSISPSYPPSYPTLAPARGLIRFLHLQEVLSDSCISKRHIYSVILSDSCTGKKHPFPHVTFYIRPEFSLPCVIPRLLLFLSSPRGVRSFSV